MPDYSEGKIYKLECLDDDDSLIYIGSTTQKLNKRLSGHKGDYKFWKNGKKTNCTSFRLFEEYGIENVVITLLEEIECENKEELIACEREWVRKLDCVNKQIPGRTKKEHYDDNKEEISKQKKTYYKLNKDDILENKKIYRENNKDVISESHKKYYEENKKEISKKYKIYYELHKDEITAKHKKKRKDKKEIENEIKSIMLILIDI